MDQIVKDGLVIVRYINSCETIEQLQVCDNILWQFKLTHCDVSFVQRLLYGEKVSYTVWFRFLANFLDTKEKELKSKEDKVK